MKFWGCMHHKFRENSKGPLKDDTTGNKYVLLSAHPSLDNQDAYPTACTGPRHNTGFRKQHNLFQESSFAGPKENTDENFKDGRNSDFFHGFLAIGTLGGETLLDEPATPTFGMSPWDPAEDNVDVMANDLKLISNELDKFLDAEAKEGHNQTSGRNSDTNTIASTIEAIEGLDVEEDDQPMKFPLQDYLLGSPIELPETKMAGKDRASLGDLFKAAETQDMHSETKYAKKKKQTSSNHKSAKHLLKKVLKKLHPSSRSSASGKTEEAFTKKKFQKMVQLFHRKVHPADSMESEINGSMTDPENSKAKSDGLISKKENPCHERSKRWIQYELRRPRSNGNGGHWIKTDEDYFVLEL